MRSSEPPRRKAGGNAPLFRVSGGCQRRSRQRREPVRRPGPAMARGGPSYVEGLLRREVDVVNDEPTAMDEVVLPGSVVWTAPRTLVGRPLIGATSAARVAAWASVQALVGVALLLAPGRLFSREMTWDLLYNLEGAWHLHNGHVPARRLPHPARGTDLRAHPHRLRDGRHDPAGGAGRAPRWCCAGTRRWGRWPPHGGCRCCRQCCSRSMSPLLVMMPANVGDRAATPTPWPWPTTGGAGVPSTILCLLLFVPPRGGVARPWIEPLLGAALLLLRLLPEDHLRHRQRCRHRRRHRDDEPRAPSAAAVDRGAGCRPAQRRAAPAAAPYLADVWAAASTGYTRSSIADQVLSMVSHRAEFAVYAVVVMFVVWLWRRGRAPAESSFLAASWFSAVGMFVLSQNAQAGDIPVALVPFFLICRTLWRAWPRRSAALLGRGAGDGRGAGLADAGGGG